MKEFIARTFKRIRARRAVKKGIRLAIEYTCIDDLVEGDIVSHRRDLIGYRLIRINRDKGMAVVEIPAEKSLTGKRIQKELSLEGFFDTKLVLRYLVMCT